MCTIWTVEHIARRTNPPNGEPKAFKLMKELRADAEAEGLRETICDLVADLEASDLAKLRLLLKILKQA